MPMAVAFGAADWINLEALNRYPNMKICFSESGIGWIPYLLERADYSHAQHKAWTHSDQYLSAPEEVRPYILTSMMKRVDTAVFNTIEDYVNGSFTPGITVLDLSVDGVGYATSGGFIDDIVDQLENYKAEIISGDIPVPTTP